MKLDKILGYIGLGIIILVIIYLILRVVGIAKTVSTEEILLSFAGGQALLDVYLIRAIGRIEGRLGLKFGKEFPEE
jgi:Na+-transporting methylmalonyl-CoA/oxaloacetate decarboxylase gamma subunit